MSGLVWSSLRSPVPRCRSCTSWPVTSAYANSGAELPSDARSKLSGLAIPNGPPDFDTRRPPRRVDVLEGDRRRNADSNSVRSFLGWLAVGKDLLTYPALGQAPGAYPAVEAGLWRYIQS